MYVLHAKTKLLYAPARAEYYNFYRIKDMTQHDDRQTAAPSAQDSLHRAYASARKTARATRIQPRARRDISYELRPGRVAAL